MATIDFKYTYPYADHGDARFQGDWSESRVTLNGCYTSPFVFNNVVPKVSHMKILLNANDTGYGTSLDRNWDLYVRRENGSWTRAHRFHFPKEGSVEIEFDVDNLSISQWATVPSSNPGSSRTWELWFNTLSFVITEQVEVYELSTGRFVYGIFPATSGIIKRANEVFANINGTLVQATDVLVNIGGTLKSVTPVYSGHVKTTEECIKLFKYVIPEDGRYKVYKRTSKGIHELRVYFEDLTPYENEEDFLSTSLFLSAGTVLYFSVMHYYPYSNCESYIQIYKED